MARAIYDARHPVISGVGHETDFTITDFVADLRAPTPSAAAELAVPDLSSLRPALAQIDGRLLEAVKAGLAARQRAVRAQTQLLWLLSPRRTLDSNRQQVDVLTGRLTRAAVRILDRRRAQLAVAGASLSAVSPLATLGRGFAIVRDANGHIIRSATAVHPGQVFVVQLGDGQFGAQVTT